MKALEAKFAVIVPKYIKRTPIARSYGNGYQARAERQMHSPRAKPPVVLSLWFTC
ncbi:hypothetical protein NBRC116601_28350 [Cognatishimia sp. WU-CL00825]